MMVFGGGNLDATGSFVGQYIDGITGTITIVNSLSNAVVAQDIPIVCSDDDGDLIMTISLPTTNWDFVDHQGQIKLNISGKPRYSNIFNISVLPPLGAVCEG